MIAICSQKTLKNALFVDPIKIAKSLDIAGFVVNPKLTYSQGIKTELYDELRWSIEQSIDGTLDYFELE